MRNEKLHYFLMLPFFYRCPFFSNAFFDAEQIQKRIGNSTHAPADGEEHERMSEADFAWLNDCSKCGNDAYYFVTPKI